MFGGRMPNILYEEAKYNLNINEITSLPFTMESETHDNEPIIINDEPVDDVEIDSRQAADDSNKRMNWIQDKKRNCTAAVWNHFTIYKECVQYAVLYPSFNKIAIYVIGYNKEMAKSAELRKVSNYEVNFDSNTKLRRHLSKYSKCQQHKDALNSVIRADDGDANKQVSQSSKSSLLLYYRTDSSQQFEQLQMKFFIHNKLSISIVRFWR